MYDNPDTDDADAGIARRQNTDGSATPSARRERRGRTPSTGARGPPRGPWLYRLVGDRSGQSTTIGVALMLVVAAIGVTAVVALGGTALTNTQESADLKRTEHAMTLLDSRGAMAALGETESQRVTLSGSGDGQYEVRPDTGWIRVTHTNYTGPPANDDEVVFNRSLGSVRYTVGDTVIAYQGGGIWRTEANGTAMVSPPEFHYRDQTLTMPLVRVAGSGGASGRVTADVSPVDPGPEVTRVFPNETTSYPDGTAYDNPVENGTVTVTVHSEHYRGWATYFAERTEGNLTVDHTARTASIELVTLGGAPGNFDMPLVGESLDTPSVAQQHNVTDFQLTLAPDSSNANAFNQLHWSLYHQGPSGQQFELHFAGQGRCDESTGTFTKGSTELSVSVYYRHNSSAPSEEWETVIGDPSDTTDPIHVTCNADDAPVLHANLTSSFAMEYDDIVIPGTDNKWHYGNQIKSADVPEELVFDQHAADPGPSNEYDDGDTEEIGFLIDHYFSRMGPDFELTVDAGPGGSQNRVSEEFSSGVLWYDTVDGEEFIQYLHITENEVRVELEG